MTNELEHVNPVNMSDEAGFAVLLYDGECGFCAASVQFVLQHEHHHNLRFASLQSSFGTSVLARFPELIGVNSMVWLERPTGSKPELVFVRSEAVRKIISYLGSAWRLALVLYIIPSCLRDKVYDLVACNRYRLSRFSQQCILPSSDVRSRFID